ITPPTNAKHHNEEDEIISIAGQEGSITISTNIAGRGTDIKIDDEIEKLGGLHVIATQLAESKRVDLQLYGRTSRQGQVGSVKVFLSLEDELMEKNYNNNFLNFLKKRIHTRLMKYCAILLYKYAQIKQEKKSSKIRLEMLQKDFDFAKRISFVK
ncbi:preprotein translocase subunit SecA, partial [Arcobacter sp. HD9-500m-PIT-SAG02]